MFKFRLFNIVYIIRLRKFVDYFSRSFSFSYHFGMAHTKTEDVPIPDIIYDKSTGIKYVRGKFYGKVTPLMYFDFILL